MAFIWSESTRFIITLLAAILGALAVLMLPGRKRILEGNVEGYRRRGVWLVFTLGILVLGAALGLGYEWYRLGRADLWVTGNVFLLSALGAAVLAGNIWTIRRIKRGVEGDEPVEVEVEDVADAGPGLAPSELDSATEEHGPGPAEAAGDSEEGAEEERASEL